MQRYGASRIEEVKLTTEWYRQHMPRLVAAVEDRTVDLPRDADIMADLRCLRRINGVVQVPRDARARGADGRTRHGDSAVALAMLLYAWMSMEPVAIESQSTGRRRAGLEADLDLTAPRGRGQRLDVGFGAVGGRLNTGGF